MHHVDERLTAFQQELESRARTLLRDAGRTVESRETLEADVPFYSKAPEVVVKIVARGAEIWLYDQEATFSVDGIARVYEIADYRDSDGLADAFVADLKKALAPHR